MLKRVSLVAAALVGVALAALPARAAEQHVVQIISDYDNLRMYFSPKTVTIKPGDTVVWVNQAEEEHNIASYPDGYPKGAKPINSHYLKKKGEKWSYTFKAQGTYEYHCVPHLPMGMRGKVIVGRASADSEFHVPSAAELATYRKRLEEFYDNEEFAYEGRKNREAEDKGDGMKKADHKNH